MTYTLHQWEQLIRGISREDGRIFFTKHALSQMKSRCITRGMVIDVLRLGSLHRIPEPDIKTGDMVCKMERYVAGQHIAAIVALADESASDCVVVTSYKF